MDQVANTFKLLSDQTRLRLLVLLRQQQLCVCELSGILEAPQPRISKNLSKLRDMNLVLDERKEKYVYYSLNNSNDLLNNSIDYMINHIDQYPVLKEDQLRLNHKEKYVTIYSTTNN